MAASTNEHKIHIKTHTQHTCTGPLVCLVWVRYHIYTFLTHAQENEFLAPTRWWECASNWLTKDSSPAKHPPCGDDNAIFGMVGTGGTISGNNQDVATTCMGYIT